MNWCFLNRFLVLMIIGSSLLNCIALSAQTTAIKSQIRIVEKSRGLTKIKAQILLSEMYYKQGSYDSAMKVAKEARKAAKDSNRISLRATAANREAKASYKSNALLGRRNANTILKKSLKYLPGNRYPIKRENLQLLIKYAGQRGDEKDVKKFKKELALLKGEAIIKKQRAEANELKDSLTSLNTQTQSLESETQHLAEAVDNQSIRIQKLSDEQIRQELKIAHQNHLLDSIAYVRMLDSFKLIRQKNTLMEQSQQIKEKEMQETVYKSQRNLWIALTTLGLLVLGGLYSRFTSMRKHNHQLEEKNVIIEAEQQRSEELLLNILPKSVADELRESGSAKARKFKSVTVMFTDFKNFSQFAHDVSPEQLVGELDFYFRKFDEIIASFGLEKIKTIGDSYMCAGGLPKVDRENARKVVSAALAIQEFMNSTKKQRSQTDKNYFEARIGIHTGPLVAGIVGKRKYAYDIWGDTVNIASRMESNCEPGAVNISKPTFDLVRSTFECEPRGKVEAKNIGEVEMYYVLGRKV